MKFFVDSFMHCAGLQPWSINLQKMTMKCSLVEQLSFLEHLAINPGQNMVCPVDEN